MAYVLRTKKQIFVDDSSSGYTGEQLDVGGIGGNIVAVTVIPTSGSLEVQGRSGDDWVSVNSGGMSFDIDFDQNRAGRMPYFRGDGGDCDCDLFYTVKTGA